MDCTVCLCSDDHIEGHVNSNSIGEYPHVHVFLLFTGLQGAVGEPSDQDKGDRGRAGAAGGQVSYTSNLSSCFSLLCCSILSTLCEVKMRLYEVLQNLLQPTNLYPHVCVHCTNTKHTSMFLQHTHTHTHTHYSSCPYCVPPHTSFLPDTHRMTKVHLECHH